MQTQREQKHPKERGGGDSAKWSQIGLKLYTTVQQGHILSSLIFSATKIQKSISCENLSLYLDLARQDEKDELPSVLQDLIPICFLLHKSFYLNDNIANSVSEF